MPSYDYRCKECDNRYELFLPISRRDEKVGSHCELEKCNGVIARVFKSPRFVFIGDGFDSTNLTDQELDSNPDYWSKEDPSNPKVKVMK
tara:strand:+ start:221 stop:487 length:267 start_codon:yes stop_codon:yes gene_type:complete